MPSQLDWTWLSPVIIVAAALVFIVLERAYPYDAGQRLFRKGFFVDLVGYGLVQSYLLGLLIQTAIGAADRGLAGRVRFLGGWPVPVQVLFFFVTHDLYIYWFHRLQHRSKWLWRTHEAHHSVDDVDWLAGTRSHSLEILINQTIEFAPITLLGAAPEVALIKATIDAVWGMYIHSNIDVRAGWLQYVINGPQMHRWHHARELAERDANFGTKLAIWDWTFKTAFLPRHKPAAYGLASDEPYPDGYVGQHVAAFRAFPAVGIYLAASGGRTDARRGSARPRGSVKPSDAESSANTPGVRFRTVASAFRGFIHAKGFDKWPSSDSPKAGRLTSTVNASVPSSASSQSSISPRTE